MDAFMQYGVVAGMQAMRDSGLQVTEANADRIGVLMGSGMGGLESIEEAYDKYLETHSPKKVSPFFIPASIINLVSGHLSIAFKVTGPNLAVATACTTSTHAMGLAMRLIQYGDADAMLAGGSEMATCPTGMSGFAQAKALSQRNDDPQGRAAHGTRIATASSWATAPARCCSRSTSTPRRAARKSMPRSSASE